MPESARTPSIRAQLHRQIDSLSDARLAEVAPLLSAILTRDTEDLPAEWTEQDWTDFSLAQFFDKDAGVEYDLSDAEDPERP
jgi:hypothetical protein